MIEQLIKIGEKFPLPREQDRINNILENEQLYQGNDYNVFEQEILERLDLKDKRYFSNDTRFKETSTTSPKFYYNAVNMAGSVTRLFTDLLFGNGVRVETENEQDQELIDELMQREKIDHKIVIGSNSQSYTGDCIFKLRLKDEKALIDLISTEYYYAVVEEDSSSRIKADVLAWKVKNKNQEILRVEYHTKGYVEYFAYAIDNDVVGSRIEWDNELLGEVPDKNSEGRIIEETGIETSLIFKIPNSLIIKSVYGISDYDNSKTLFRELDIRLTQIARILDKHSDPSMYGSGSNIEVDESTGKEVVKTASYFITEIGEQAPGYITWDAQLESNFKAIDQIKEGIFISTDTNSLAFSMMEGGNIPSGTAIKRAMYRPLSRTKRKRMMWSPILKELIESAIKLEHNKEIEVKIVWSDGLPQDPKEDAEIMSIRTGGKATQSVKTAIKKLDKTNEEQTENEIQRIDEDNNKEAGQQVLLNEFGNI